METMLTWEEYNNREDKLTLFKNAIKSGRLIDGDVIDDFIDRCKCGDWENFIEDYEYEDFEESDRWTIGQIYVLNIDGMYYSCWKNIWLTETGNSEFYTQTFTKVVQKPVTRYEWVKVE